MTPYQFVGWPLTEALLEASKRGIKVQETIELSPPKEVEDGSKLYVVQERWLNEHTVVFLSGLRLMGKAVSDDL
jgi:hypothetical protein